MPQGAVVGPILGGSFVKSGYFFQPLCQIHNFLSISAKLGLNERKDLSKHELEEKLVKISIKKYVPRKNMRFLQKTLQVLVQQLPLEVYQMQF